MIIDLKAVREQAQKELQQEQVRTAVDREKQRIRLGRGFWRKWFPWRIRIININEV